MNEGILTEGIIPVIDKTKILVGLTNKSDGSKVAVTAEGYESLDKSSYNIDGIIIRTEDLEAELLFSLSEVDAIVGAGPTDMPETDKRRKGHSAPIQGTEYDGEERTRIQLEFHPDVHEEGCAICEAIKFGWLPSYGEMTLAYKYMDDFNILAELVGATSLSNSEYWTSTQYSDDYMWSVDFENNIAEFWRSKGTTMKVRPCKSASDYQEIKNG